MYKNSDPAEVRPYRLEIFIKINKNTRMVIWNVAKKLAVKVKLVL